MYMNTNELQSEMKEVLLKYKFAKDVLETDLNILLKEYELTNGYNPVEHVKSRIKSSESAIKKLERKGYDITPSNIVKHVHDMVGLRIVCSFLSDVSQIVNVIKRSNLFEIKEERDYIKTPKDSGYISYHLNVLVPIHLIDTTEYIEAEIQIRTVAMDFWASLDHKLRYKVSSELPDEIIKEVYDCSNVIKELDCKMEKLHAKIGEIKK